MCRWLAYTGAPVLLKDALISPAHSLIDQSLHSRLGAEATNGDGFGIGWYDEQPEPGVFKSIEPAWNDQNLRELAGHISSGHFFAHIRAAIGSAVQQTNCHPFRHGRWLFMHNGFIGDFPAVKRDLALAVDESLYTNDRHHRRRADVGVPLFERGQVALAVLHQERDHAAAALP
jgi:glutamine amidotransferase